MYIQTVFKVKFLLPSGPNIMSDEVETLGALIPFSQNFSEISVRQKMEHVSSVRPTGKFPEKVENLKRWARFPGWNFPNGISCSIYTFLVLYTSFNCYQLGSHLGVPSGNGLSAVPGFTIKWNNFLPIGKNPFLFPLKFSDFLPNWKASTLS